MSRYDYPTIVVTGVGAVTPIGNTAQEYWTGMMNSANGAGPITRFDAEKFDTRFACEVKHYDPLLHINRKETQRMDLFTQFAISASAMAVEDSGIDFEKVNKERAGVIIGSGIGGMWTYHHQQQNLYDRDGNPDRISPFFVPMLISDIAADALMIMQRGDADVMLVGGSEAVVCPMGIGGFNSMKALSTRNEDPMTASRPFDLGRDGFVMGEGSGVMVIETLEHAMNRGAEKIYGILAGIGLTDDAFHITQPAPGGEGAVRSMKLCIQDAGLNITDIDYINAHGTSTPFNDKNESAAIKTVFGEHAYNLAVSSTKSMTGHLLGAAGAIEAIATVLAMKHSMIPPTINYTTPDPDCDLNYVPNAPIAKPIKAAISNTFGFGGHNASICFKAYEG
jgi:3-oxoacyl-[acyl-carrier-protein] synthase II